MIIKSDKDLRGILRIGQICGQCILHMLRHVEPGITTRELDRIGADFLRRQGATSAPITAYNYPGWTCISINDAAAHGIPDDYRIQPGDVVNIDVSAVLEGYWGDTGASMLVPPVDARLERLLEHTREALQAGIGAARAGAPLYEIGKAVQAVARRGGYSIIEELGGHGVGQHIHEKPSVPNHFNRRAKEPLVEGLVMTIEPFLNLGKGRIYTDDDGWTLRSVDRTISAQYEHTIIITGDTPIRATHTEETWW